MKQCEEHFTSLWERILLADAYHAMHQDVEEEMQAYGVPSALTRQTLATLDNSLCAGLEQLMYGSLSDDNRDIFTWVLARYIDKLQIAAYQEEAVIHACRSEDTTDMPDIIEMQLEAAQRYRCTAESAQNMLNALM